MITRFKIFEYRNSYKRKYNVGDYVVVEDIGKIYITTFEESNYFEYHGISEDNKMAMFRYSDIKRKLTDEEKADFELKVDTNKYNL